MIEAITRSGVWSLLKQRLKPGDTFHTWSITGRARSIPFKVAYVDNWQTGIRKLNDNKAYEIFRSSAESIAGVWSDYIAGRTTRQDMREATFSSSHV